MASEGSSVQIETPAFDHRFPHTSSTTKRCWVNYNMYQRCVMDKDEEHPECRKYYKTFRSLCPDEWVEKFVEDEVCNNLLPASGEGVGDRAAACGSGVACGVVHHVPGSVHASSKRSDVGCPAMNGANAHATHASGA